MSRLSITLIDVGWGDSILVEILDNTGQTHFGLVDCNDTSNQRSAYLFVKRFLERQGKDLTSGERIFDFVLLTHGHADHANGIQAMMSAFKTDWFWYPKSVDFGGFAKLISYANKYPQKVNRHQAVDSTKLLPDIGDVKLDVLWPPYEPGGVYDSNNENNNSIVLVLTLGEVSFLLSGDCEADNWDQILGEIPGIPGLAVFQAPHHGAVNGVFTGHGDTPWLDVLPGETRIAMSSHIRPHNHPAPEVISELSSRNIEPFRTDQHYHLTFSTDGTLDASGLPNVTEHWSHA